MFHFTALRRMIMASMLVVVAAFLIGTPGHAGDTADRHILGYSKDARWFGFVEHGVQDGSGFPYSNLFILDMRRDRWAPGTPVRTLIKDENATVRDAYENLLAKASGKLRKYGTRFPGRLLASRPITEDWDRSLEPDKSNALHFKVRYPYGHDTTVRVNVFDAGPKSACDGLWTPKGLAVTIGPGVEAATEVYRDTYIPKSRKCAQGYVLADVYDAPDVQFGKKNGRAVALIYVFTHGFEGKDARFIAIPFDIPGAN